MNKELKNEMAENYSVKPACSICEKAIDFETQKAHYYSDDDKPICEECWDSGRGND
jgi:hypothetical protein